MLQYARLLGRAVERELRLRFNQTGDEHGSTDSSVVYAISGSRGREAKVDRMEEIKSTDKKVADS
ncbi:hypothetical protein BDP81DRAFT_436953 [Colletotrichum phormii]|uniref:Uncharacterized protein n=1 Tax=Colletotrichum phormii TaxID=359342 RepID=A0AAJ0EAE8_9PEZI|nr:uncharacterized protein BDP81DRAFT_436953 [Colletotrichum phormii]KAK1625019.1 hypothetical protein BDP81DRAFT_436953 [Colletotrichum phormii]